MEKITILALHLGYGGIEKCITSLANMLVDKYQIEIICTYKVEEKPAFVLDERIQIKYLLQELPNHEQVKMAWKQKRLLLLIKAIFYSCKILYKRKKYMIQSIKLLNSHFIISTRDIHNLWLSKYRPANSVCIGWEHNHHNYNKRYIRKIVLSIKDLDYAVFVSQDQQMFYKNQVPSNTVKCLYIPNSIDNIPDLSSKLEKPNIISIGRLSKEKGMDDIIRVFALLHTNKTECSLTIVGDGEERKNLEQLVKTLGIDSVVSFVGYQSSNKIQEYLFESSLLVMGSHTESFGIVILESFACGVPAIAFDSAQGACDLIKHGINGYLIKHRDLKEMAAQIQYLLSDYNKLKNLGKHAKEDSFLFMNDVIRNQWVNEIFLKNKKK